jgi:hypothetical protein
MKKLPATKMPTFDTETNKMIGYMEIPDAVLAGAARVYAWMNSQPNPQAIRLNGLMLSDE